MLRKRNKDNKAPNGTPSGGRGGEGVCPDSPKGTPSGHVVGIREFMKVVCLGNQGLFVPLLDMCS